MKGNWWGERKLLQLTPLWNLIVFRRTHFTTRLVCHPIIIIIIIIIIRVWLCGDYICVGSAFVWLYGIVSWLKTIYGSLYIHVPTISMCSFPSDLIMVVQVVNSSSSCLVRSSTPTTVCLSTLPTTPTLFRSVPPPRSSTTTWSGLDLLVGSLVWSSLKDSYWMCFSQGLSINHYSASEYMHKCSLVDTVFPRNLAAPIRRLIPINAALEILPHGKGSLDSKYVECT